MIVTLPCKAKKAVTAHVSSSYRLFAIIQQAQNICITFVQRRPDVFDVGPTLYKYHTNILCLLGTASVAVGEVTFVGHLFSHLLRMVKLQVVIRESLLYTLHFVLVFQSRQLLLPLTYHLQMENKTIKKHSGSFFRGGGGTLLSALEMKFHNR